MDKEPQNNQQPSLQTRQKNARKFQNFLIKVGLVYVVISLALFYLFSALLEDRAYHDMSHDEIRNISEMVFESMYSEMLSGKGREGIEAAAKRMSKTGPGFITSIVRGEVVAELFGENKVDSMRRTNDLAIFDVFKSGQEKIVQKDDRFRYLYPATFREACKQCHLNSSPGQVAAVIEIIYPIINLKVSTSYVNKLMLAYFVFSFIVLIGFLTWTYRHEENWSD